MTAPKLKFKDITGNAHLNWRKVKLSEVTSLITKGTTPTSLGHAFQKHGINFIKVESLSNQGSFIKNKFAYIDQETNSKLLRSQLSVGDVLFSIAGVIGRTAVVTPDILPANTNQALAIIRPQSKSILNSNFLHFALNSETVKKISQDASSQLAQANLSLGDLANLTLDLPTIDEQEKISSFLFSIDEKISLLIKKYELLSTFKKGVIQRIFNQDIRFKDTNSRKFPDWMDTRLKEVVEKFIVPMRDKPKLLNGDIPWCRIEDFNGRYLYSSKSNQGVSLKSAVEMNLKIYPVNTLLVSCSANLGVCAIVKRELITNQTFIGLFPNPQILDIEFFYHLMTLSAAKLNKLSSGTTISYLSREQFENFSISIPVIEEQRKIASFLSLIEDSISNIQKQLELTQQYKQGLLQQMFV